MVTIILLAMVAGFVALRLYSVLGKRTGHEQPIAKPLEGAARPVTALRPTQAALNDGAPVVDAAVGESAAAGVRQIAAADPTFNPAAFLEGARSAYGMILAAFWKGDEKELAQLADAEVASAFREAIAGRKEAGLVLENRLISIERAQIERAELDGQTAHVTVRFKADIAAVTRNAEGEVVAGSLSDAVVTDDVWTFSRNIRAADPNWILTETDEAA
ncbi:Tim44/TimA family putative adaptor protein [Sphingomonas sp. ID0503]|uniref:Tim44/TimA family putative adaptor protein n=1 Tax=Sphingomonas sp. ID0503 TaxID=3399691 RepID=UPI003AFABA2B